MAAIISNALGDIRAALKLWRVWLALAQEDIGDQHRRTTLGPLWLLINYLAFAGTFIFVFQRGDSAMPGYAAYVAVGLLAWFFMMEVITQSVTLFVREESFIKGTRLPLSVYVMRLAVQALIRTAYALVGCLAIVLASGIAFSPAWLWSLAGVMLILAAAPAAIVLFAFLGAWFPDSQFIVSNLMRVGMFLTPVFWVYEGAGGVRGVFYHWNPFTYVLEIVRTPILTGTVPVNAFVFCALGAAALWILALLLLGRYRRQVVFLL